MFSAGVVPDEWKCAIVVLLLKQNKPTDRPDFYRPISLTSYLAKAMENAKRTAEVVFCYVSLQFLYFLVNTFYIYLLFFQAPPP